MAEPPVEDPVPEVPAEDEEPKVRPSSAHSHLDLQVPPPFMDISDYPLKDDYFEGVNSYPHD